MPGMPEMVRALTDCLDAAGNTTAAIGKGFAIASAAMVSLALLGVFAMQARASNVDILNPWAFTGPLVWCDDAQRLCRVGDEIGGRRGKRYGE